MKYTNKLVKHAAVLMLASGLLMACNSSEKKDVNSQNEPATEVDAHQDHDAATELALNKGAKWEADSSTNANVAELNAIVVNANPVVLEDYKKTGEALKVGITKMVNECKMQGADHDALHQWLEPLMDMNKQLLDVTSVEKGKEVFEMINQHIDKYNLYFE